MTRGHRAQYSRDKVRCSTGTGWARVSRFRFVFAVAEISRHYYYNQLLLFTSHPPRGTPTPAVRYNGMTAGKQRPGGRVRCRFRIVRRPNFNRIVVLNGLALYSVGVAKSLAGGNRARSGGGVDVSRMTTIRERRFLRPEVVRDDPRETASREWISRPIVADRRSGRDVSRRFRADPGAPPRMRAPGRV